MRMRCTRACREKSGRGQVPNMSAPPLEIGAIVEICGLNGLEELNGFHGKIVDFDGIHYGVRVFTRDRTPLLNLLPWRMTLVLSARDYRGSRVCLSESLFRASSQ